MNLNNKRKRKRNGDTKTRAASIGSTHRSRWRFWKIGYKVTVKENDIMASSKEFLKDLIETMYDELPEPKRKKKKEAV